MLYTAGRDKKQAPEVFHSDAIISYPTHGRQRLVALGGIEPTVFRVKGERPEIH